MVINEEQASVVRWMFESYANGSGFCAITRTLEERGIRTRMGKSLWSTDHVKTMLQNHTYACTRYYNAVMTVPAIKSDGTTAKRGKYVPRDRSEWIPVKVRPDDPRFTQSRENVVASALVAQDFAAVSS